MNPYMPEIVKIKDIKQETVDVKTFRISSPKGFKYLPGQFLEVSSFGVGEAPISITSTPTRKDLEISVKKVGGVTESLHEAEIGDKIGVRGPYGNGFPVNKLRGRDILFIGGGIGLAPLRSLINYSLDNRNDLGHISILYGARTPDDLVFRDELRSWGDEKDTGVYVTVDNADDKWGGNVGVVPKLLEKIEPDLRKTTAVVCGPPVMIKFTVKALLEMGLGDEQIIFTLERMMKCGIGKCGHCNIGEKYVCIDGPVFSYVEMKDIMEWNLGFL
ncbi:MAG: FAD/NAD(P)-binding protein [Candidatus Altiarchaeota archaeon]|nr:FAD/NAD(P)-binding protein [Candidatus Altiarchaeota archaeon]